MFQRFCFVLSGVSGWLLAGSLCFATELVKIRLQSNLQQTQISGYALSFQSKEKFSPYQTVAIPSLQVAKIRLQQNQGRKVWQVQFLGSETSSMEVYSHQLIVMGEMIKLGADPAPGRLYLHPKESGRFDVIAQLDIESYLAGVLPSEMPVSWPLEALKAQVVASRSYMMSVMKERTSKPYHLEASIHDQVYKAINLIGADSASRRKIRRVLEETRGEFIADKMGHVYKAYYHADCGGQTEEPQNVWGVGPSNGTVVDKFCPRSPNANWSFSTSRENLKESLATQYPEVAQQGLEGLLISKRTASGRIAEINLLLNESSPLNISAQDFRKVIGFNKLKSTNFRLQWFGDELRIVGKGHGHGVGLCQWGSRHLASLGKDYRSILSHYYPHTRLRKDGTFLPSTPSLLRESVPEILQVPRLSEKEKENVVEQRKKVAL